MDLVAQHREGQLIYVTIRRLHLKPPCELSGTSAHAPTTPLALLRAPPVHTPANSPFAHKMVRIGRGGATFECSTSYPLGVLGPDSLQTPHRLWCVTSAPRKSTLSIGRCRRTFQTHDADPDIPILKQAKAEYEKLKWAAEVRSLVTLVESAAIVFLPASVLIELVIFAKAPSDAAFTPSPQYARQRRQEPAPFHLPNAENRTAASFPLLN